MLNVETIMYNRSLILAIIVVFSVCVSARAHADNRSSSAGSLRIGMILGANLANLVGKDVPNNEIARRTNRLGFAIGALALYSLHELIAIQIETVYTTKGTEVEVGGVLDSTVNLDYIEIPLLVRVSLPLDVPVIPYILVGPEVSLTLDAEVESVDGNIVDWNNIVKPYNIGLIAGIGAEWVISPRWRFAFDARYDRGLISLDATDNDIDFTNRAFFFMLSVGANVLE